MSYYTDFYAITETFEALLRKFIKTKSAMKIINYLPALTFVILSFFSIGQEEKPLKRIVVSDVQLYSGMLFKMDVNGTLADFRSLAPQSELLKIGRASCRERV